MLDGRNTIKYNELHNNERGVSLVASSEALKRAIKKYDQEKIDRIPLRVPKGKKELIQAHAAEQGESVNSFLNRAIDETMKRDLSDN